MNNDKLRLSHPEQWSAAVNWATSLVWLHFFRFSSHYFFMLCCKFVNSATWILFVHCYTHTLIAEIGNCLYACMLACSLVIVNCFKGDEKTWTRAGECLSFNCTWICYRNVIRLKRAICHIIHEISKKKICSFSSCTFFACRFSFFIYIRLHNIHAKQMNKHAYIHWVHSISFQLHFFAFYVFCTIQYWFYIQIHTFF